MATSHPLATSNSTRSSNAVLPLLISVQVTVPSASVVAGVLLSRLISSRRSSATSIVTSSRRSNPSPVSTTVNEGSVLAAREGGSTMSHPTTSKSPTATASGASHEPNNPASRSSCTEGDQGASPLFPTSHSKRRVSPVGWLPEPNDVV